MAGCPSQTFTGITPAVKAYLEAKGAAAGLPIAGDTGSATTMGVTLKWVYDGAAETITITCTDAPFFVPCSTVTAKVTELVEGGKAQSA
jgi:hypothetical protein